MQPQKYGVLGGSHVGGTSVSGSSGGRAGRGGDGGGRGGGRGGRGAEGNDVRSGRGADASGSRGRSGGRGGKQQQQQSQPHQVKSQSHRHHPETTSLSSWPSGGGGRGRGGGGHGGGGSSGGGGGASSIASSLQDRSPSNPFTSPQARRLVVVPLQFPSVATYCETIAHNMLAEFWAVYSESVGHGGGCAKGARVTAKAVSPTELAVVPAASASSSAASSSSSPDNTAAESLMQHLLIINGRPHLVTQCQQAPPGGAGGGVMRVSIKPPLTRGCSGGTLKGVTSIGFVGSYVAELSALLQLSDRQQQHGDGGGGNNVLRSILMPMRDLPGDYVSRRSSCSGGGGGGGSESIAMNPSQNKAVASLRWALEKIQGPPGTGKSTTISSIIATRLPPNARVLVTCSRNVAVESIAQKLQECEHCKGLGGVLGEGLLVVGNPTRIGPTAQRYLLSSKAERAPAVLRLAELAQWTARAERLINNALDISGLGNQLSLGTNKARGGGGAGGGSRSHPRAARALWILARRAWLRRRYGAYPALAAWCGRVSIAASMISLDAATESRRGLLLGSKVILCTVASSSRLMREWEEEVGQKQGQGQQQGDNSLFIHTAIIDECGCTPESSVALLVRLQGLRNLILVGDHKQLPPTSMVAPQQLDGTGHNRSLLERCVLASGSYHRLREQYRMHPAMCAVVSALFYQGDLVTPPAVARERQSTEWVLGPALQWIPCRSPETSPADGGKSYSNRGEVEAVVAVVRHIRRQCRAYAQTQASGRKRIQFTVAVITCYKGQFKELQASLGSGDDGAEVITVDSCQGSEYDFVIVSPVRSNPAGRIGFVRDKQRICVACSRARRGLIICGNDVTLSRGSEDWAFVRNHCAVTPVEAFVAGQYGQMPPPPATAGGDAPIWDEGKTNGGCQSDKDGWSGQEDDCGDEEERQLQAALKASKLSRTVRAPPASAQADSSGSGVKGAGGWDLSAITTINDLTAIFGDTQHVQDVMERFTPQGVSEGGNSPEDTDVPSDFDPSEAVQRAFVVLMEDQEGGRGHGAASDDEDEEEQVDDWEQWADNDDNDNEDEDEDDEDDISTAEPASLPLARDMSPADSWAVEMAAEMGRQSFTTRADANTTKSSVTGPVPAWGSDQHLPSAVTSQTTVASVAELPVPYFAPSEPSQAQEMPSRTPLQFKAYDPDSRPGRSAGPTAVSGDGTGSSTSTIADHFEAAAASGARVSQKQRKRQQQRQEEETSSGTAAPTTALLMSFGFSRGLAMQASQKYKDVDAAVEWCLAAQQDEEQDNAGAAGRPPSSSSSAALNATSVSSASTLAATLKSMGHDEVDEQVVEYVHTMLTEQAAEAAAASNAAGQPLSPDSLPSELQDAVQELSGVLEAYGVEPDDASALLLSHILAMMESRCPQRSPPLPARAPVLQSKAATTAQSSLPGLRTSVTVGAAPVIAGSNLDDRLALMGLKQAVNSDFDNVVAGDDDDDEEENSKGVSRAKQKRRLQQKAKANAEFGSLSPPSAGVKRPGAGRGRGRTGKQAVEAMTFDS